MAISHNAILPRRQSPKNMSMNLCDPTSKSDKKWPSYANSKLGRIGVLAYFEPKIGHFDHIFETWTPDLFCPSFKLTLNEVGSLLDPN